MNRQHLARRLLLDLIGAGVLLLSSIWLWWAPQQAQIAFLLQATAALIVAFGVVLRGVRDAFSAEGRQYSDQLLSVAVLAACAYGDFVTATLVPLALDLGRLFEERTALGVNTAIQQIRALQVDQVLLVQDDGMVLTSVEQIQVGQHICIRAGDRIPVDGVIVRGQSSIDQAVMTGESKPIRVQPGQEVYAGTTNLYGELIIDTTKIGEDSALGRIIALMETAQNSRTPLLERVESWLGVYLPITLALSASVLFFTENIDRAIAVLIVSFPSSLAIAGSATMISAFSKAASMSIFIKDGETFQRLREIGTIVFDKTGTLTAGQQQIESVQPLGEWTEQDVVSWAQQCAIHSTHPVSRAISEMSADSALGIEPQEVREIPGCGVEVFIEETIVRLGRLAWLHESGVSVSEGMDHAGTWVARDGVLLGSIHVADSIRSESIHVLSTLHNMGISTSLMMTGDSTKEAHRVAQVVNISHIEAEVLPEDKWRNIQGLRENGHIVCMVGDGINDALALQESDVGIAIGTSLNHAAMSGADIALMSDDLTRIVDVFDLAERVHNTIVQNLILGFGFSIAMFALVTAGQFSALEAALVHNLGALIVIVNSSLLWRR